MLYQNVFLMRSIKLLRFTITIYASNKQVPCLRSILHRNLLVTFKRFSQIRLSLIINTGASTHTVLYDQIVAQRKKANDVSLINDNVFSLRWFNTKNHSRSIISHHMIFRLLFLTSLLEFGIQILTVLL